MLTHKPRVGEVLIYQEPSRDPVEITTKGFRGSSSSILLAKFPEDWFCGNEVEIIWTFSDGRTNPNLYHKET